MSNTNWKRAGIGACTAAALVVGAGLAFAPAANAATAADPTTTTTGLTSVVNGLTSGVTGLVNGVLGSTTTTSPITVTTGDGLTVGVNPGGTGLGVVIGTTSTGTTVTGTATNPATTTTTTTTTPTDTSSSTTPTDTSGSTSTDTTSSTPTTSTPITLSALSAVAQYATVYPAKDGYRDTVTFTLNGSASDGLQHAVGGVAKLTFGSSTVATWPVTATNQVITWNGLKDKKIVPGRYIFTATIGDSTGSSVFGSDAVDVSAKKLASTTSLLTTKSVSGTHKMAAKPLAGLKNGKVTLKITYVASHVKGKQYLVYKHAGKSLKFRILNGKHTTKSVTIPKSFTTYTVSHTWKKSTVKVRSLKHKYTYKALK